MRVLAINTYAGSLLVGASNFGCEIIGSYEDKAFCQPIAKANFPHVDHRPYRGDWPTQDLSETIVIAHPPCSAFSVQNAGGDHSKGVDAAAFQCTRVVLDYAMQNKALAVGVESVMGALAGAWIVHDKYAREHGYECYRILENGCMFGAQWRERFWAIWIRKGAAPPDWRITLTPKFLTTKDVLTGHEDGPSPPGTEKQLAGLKERLRIDAKLTPTQLDFLFQAQDPPHKTLSIMDVLWHNFYKEEDSFNEEKWYVHQDWLGGGFSTGLLKYIDPHGLAPVLLGDSFWYYNGRVLSEAGYKRLMGFPGDYIFPNTGRKDYRNSMRTALSKGVMPPIVTWLLDELGAHLGMHEHRMVFNQESYALTCRPNRIVDFRIRKEDWPERHKLPELRHYDDEREIKKYGKQLRNGGSLSSPVRA